MFIDNTFMPTSGKSASVYIAREEGGLSQDTVGTEGEGKGRG